MCKIIGIDLGNANTKTSENMIFESRVKNGITEMNKGDLKVVYEGNKFTLGTHDGALNISKAKYEKNHYKLTLLTAIAKSFPFNNIECKVVLGVPVETFNNKEIVESIKEKVRTFKNEQIIVNGATKYITIDDVDVFCESGIVFSNRERFRDEKTLVLDFGGSTIDISYWEGLRLSKYRTYKEGMFTLYEDIIKAVNDKYGANLHSSESKHIIGQDVYEIEQELKDVSFISPIVENYVDGLVSYINQYFPYESANTIQLIGGGAIALAELLQKEYENAELFDGAEFANARTFKEVGKMLWI